MTIDKQALREAAEKVNSGEWSYEEFNRMDLPGGAHIRINGRGAIYCLNKPTGGIEQSRAVMAYIAAFNPKVALALLDKNLQLQREKDAIEAVALALRDDMRHAREQLEAAEKCITEQREYYEGVIADGSKRIAELEANKGKPVMFIDGDISASDAEKLAAVIREWEDVPAPVVPDEMETRELAAEVELPDVEKWRSVDAVRAQNAYKVLVSKVLAAAGIGVKGG
ncbi:ead/Ea22-like family protein [Salmonella enterica]|nr:ead/Ea22-like family protein [Salmonella enterica]EAY1556307.1 ead/Ea22-like family protein [Salmonella enterica]EBC8160329.1 ead/Ea22-like family protein [Salmonella enterica]EBQ6830930.1 ead/Ea22-like family protein [Salmonella enterica]ECT6513357.1 ead/Ea22-like family protein [Salmonella enterica]